LLEIVSEPDMNSAAEAVAYAKTLHSLVRWIDICDGNMQDGSFRCDANVSVRRPGAPLGTRREIKNLNSFRFLQQAIEYEIKWQIGTLEDGGKVQQATVLFDPDSGQTRVMRLKEDAHDYRYFPDPDLLPLEIGEQWIDEIKNDLPELQASKCQRYEREYMLFPEDASALTASIDTAEYFDAALVRLDNFPGITQSARVANAKHVANWVINDIGALLNRDEISIKDSPVSSDELAGLLARIFDKTLSSKLAKTVFEAMWAGEGNADEVIERKGLKQISDSGAIEKIVDQVIAANAQQVADYRSGKEKAFNSLVGQVMKASQGKANPTQANEILKKKLG
jgi:aspartyl-tRNA(Asn)/glutamyl-tRNA(Gln) amidotransferase subunit B